MDQGTVPQTRAYGDTPVVAIYVETNDTNPLNAGDYMLSNGKPFAGIVELFASNIHKRTVNGVVEPTLFLNDKMTNLLENGGYQTYVKPLQDKGIKVLLTVLGDWQGIGVANMNDTQTTQFAKILAMLWKNTVWTESDSMMSMLIIRLPILLRTAKSSPNSTR